MYGDVEAVRALARQVAGLATQARVGAGGVERASGVGWVSVGADRYRSVLAEESALLHRCADELNEAVRALQAHADAVEHRQDQIRAAERFVSGVVSQAHRRLSDVVDGTEDAVVSGARWVLEQARRAPTAGSLDWLSFAGRWGF